MQIQINDRILSSMARRLEDYLASLGKPIKHANALTATARMLNFANANTMMAVAPKAKDKAADLPAEGRALTTIGFLWSDTHEIFETQALLTPAEAERARAFLLRMGDRIENVHVGPPGDARPGDFAALSAELQGAFMLDASEEAEASALEILAETEEPAPSDGDVPARFEARLQKVSERVDAAGYLAHAPFSELEALAENDWEDVDEHVLAWLAARDDLPLRVQQAIAIAPHEIRLRLDPGIRVTLDGSAAMAWLKAARPSMHARLAAAGHVFDEDANESGPEGEGPAA